MAQIYFSGGEISLYAIVREYLSKAQKRIWLEAFSLSSEEVIDLLKRAGSKGLDVKILLDFNSENEKLWTRNNEAKYLKWAELKFGNPDIFWTYHLKMAIVDNYVLFGSANWSYSGMIKNREGIVVFDEQNILKECERIFSEDWKNGITKLRGVKKRSWFNVLMERLISKRK